MGVREEGAVAIKPRPLWKQPLIAPSHQFGRDAFNAYHDELLTLCGRASKRPSSLLS
jgi:hypothetical protein